MGAAKEKPVIMKSSKEKIIKFISRKSELLSKNAVIDISHLDFIIPGIKAKTYFR